MSKEITFTISNKTALQLLKIFGWPLYAPYRLFGKLTKITAPVKWWANMGVMVVFIASAIMAFGSAIVTCVSIAEGKSVFILGIMLWLSIAFIWLTVWLDKEYLNGWLE